MAHELESSDHMVSGNNVTPWHGLGTVVAGLLTADEALRAAKLDWTVTQGPVFDADVRQIPGFVVNQRSDSGAPLGIVADTWEPVQNSRLLEIAEAIAQTDGTDFRPVVETAGSLRGGRIVWALVQTGARSFADSEHRSYLLLSNGHDGRRALRATLTDVRVVCANTLGWAEHSIASFYVSHSRGVTGRIQDALSTLGWANDATRATFAIYEALAAAPVSLDVAAAGFKALVSPDEDVLTRSRSEAIDQLVSLFRGGRGNLGRSAFDFLNAATDYIDHAKPMRSTPDLAERRFVATALDGPGVSFKREALAHARLLAGV